MKLSHRFAEESQESALPLVARVGCPVVVERRTAADADQTSLIETLRTSATIKLWPDAGRLLGLSKNACYAAAKAGQIPVLHIGGRYLVPSAPLRALLGIEPHP